MFSTGASPNSSCVAKVSKSIRMEEADANCAGWSGNVAGGHISTSHKHVWQPWRPLGPQNNLMALLGDINKEE